MNGVMLNRAVVLRLNANYMRLGWSTGAEAFCMLMGDSKDGSPPALALDIQYKYDEFGKPMLENNPRQFDRVTWEEWLKLVPRQGDIDHVVHTSKRIIRIPTVIICSRYHLMPMKEQRMTKLAIRRRDGNRCQYTNAELTNSTFSLDHVIPRSRGGKDSWDNVVACHKDVNFKKGNKLNSEAGLVLLKKPRALKKIPLCNTVLGEHHPDHQWF